MSNPCPFSHHAINANDDFQRALNGFFLRTDVMCTKVLPQATGYVLVAGEKLVRCDQEAFFAVCLHWRREDSIYVIAAFDDKILRPSNKSGLVLGCRRMLQALLVDLCWPNNPGVKRVVWLHCNEAWMREVLRRRETGSTKFEHCVEVGRKVTKLYSRPVT